MPNSPDRNYNHAQIFHDETHDGIGSDFPWTKVTLGSASGHGLLFNDSTVTTGKFISITSSALTTGVLAEFISTAAHTGPAVAFTFDSMTTGTGATISVDAITTGTGLLIENTGEAMTSAKLLDVELTASGSSLSVITGNVAKFASSVDETRSSGTTATDYDTVLIVRTSINTTASGTHTMAGAALKIETTSTETAGTLDDDSFAIEIAHNARNDSNDIYAIKITADNAGTQLGGGIDLTSFAVVEPTINFPAGTASSIDPSMTAETGWINIAVDGTIRYVPFYAAS